MMVTKSLVAFHKVRVSPCWMPAGTFLWAKPPLGAGDYKAKKWQDWFIHSFKKYLLNIFYTPGTILGAGA